MEENEIDIVALIKSMWAGRKVILISTAVFLALGILSALTMKRTYTVSSVMVPQLGQSRSNAALARELCKGEPRAAYRSGEAINHDGRVMVAIITRRNYAKDKH